MTGFYAIIYIIFGILPSLIWLAYYLSKDLHPEPKRMITKVFFWGALMTVPVFFVQVGLTEIFNIILANLGSFGLDIITKSPLFKLNTTELVFVILYWFFVIAFSEEFFKFLVIKLKVLNSPHLDEPLDVMLYMVVSALGFAAVENVIYLFSFNQLLTGTLSLDVIRFVSAVFLHTLCSATAGYALAISFYETKGRGWLVFLGILMAMVLHGFYDFSIIALEGSSNLNIIISVIIIITLAFLTFSGFEKLKNMKGICKVN